MKTLCLHTVMRDPAFGAAAPPVFQEQAVRCADKPRNLWRDGYGRLFSMPANRKPKTKSHSLVAVLVAQPGGDSGPLWWLISQSPELTLNGVRPLQLAALQGGDLLADGPHRWLVTSLWTPEPGPAPQEVAARECPVCGGELNVAPVIECACGRYYHLEKPAEPDDPKALNCYLTSGPCALCEREPSLEPFHIPEPHETLIDEPDALATAVH